MSGPIIRRAGGDDGRLVLGGLVPSPVTAVADSRKVCRGVRQRVSRRCRISAAVHDSMVALNSLADFGEASGDKGAGNAFSEKVSDDLRRLHELNPPPPDHSVQESACEILGAAGSPYMGTEVATSVSPYARARVSWPRRGAKASHLAQYLPTDLRGKFEGEDRTWMRQIGEVRAIRKKEKSPQLYFGQGVAAVQGQVHRLCEGRPQARHVYTGAIIGREDDHLFCEQEGWWVADGGGLQASQPMVCTAAIDKVIQLWRIRACRCIRIGRSLVWDLRRHQCLFPACASEVAPLLLFAARCERG